MICKRCLKYIDECECSDIGEIDVICSKCESGDVDCQLSQMEYGYVVQHTCKKCGHKFAETL